VDWLCVEDHARALTLVIKSARRGETYNIGTRSERANIDVVGQICALLDALEPSPAGPRERLITFVPGRPGHDRRYAIDPGKIERERGWRAAESFENRLAKTVARYLANRPWWQAILKRGYKAERIALAEGAAPAP
jgi:dTDP-glucose 4,6-dehydratase